MKVRFKPFKMATVLLAAGTPALHASDTESGYNIQMLDLQGYSAPEVFGMNNLGHISGALTVGEDDRSAFILDTNSGNVTIVPELGILTAINDSGAATGNLQRSGPDDPAICAIRGADGKITTFSLPSIPSQYTDCFPRGINSQGLVTGYARGENGMIGFVHDPGKGTVEEFLPTGGQTIAQGINSAGQLVGNAWPTAADVLFPGSLSQNYSFVREPDGSFRYFIINGEVRSKARGINDQGQVAGFFHGDDEQMVGFVIDKLSESGFADIEVPADQILHLKPCSQDSKSPGTEWEPHGGVVVSAISNKGVVAGTCFDVWVLLDEEGKEVDYVDFMYAFIAAPKS